MKFLQSTLCMYIHHSCTLLFTPNSMSLRTEWHENSLLAVQHLYIAKNLDKDNWRQANIIRAETLWTNVLSLSLVSVPGPLKVLKFASLQWPPPGKLHTHDGVKLFLLLPLERQKLQTYNMILTVRSCLHHIHSIIQGHRGGPLSRVAILQARELQVTVVTH